MRRCWKQRTSCDLLQGIPCFVTPLNFKYLYNLYDEVRDALPLSAGYGWAQYNLAGWSSLVARWVHNPKAVGSNPTPATFFIYIFYKVDNETNKINTRYLSYDDRTYL